MENGRSQNLNVTYYQHYYAPLTEINAIKRQNTTIPLIVIDAEPHDIPAFLTAFNMPFQPENQLDNLAKQAKPFIALVRHTATFQQNMTTKYPEMQFRFLTNAERHYPKAIICSPK
jgi:hypothetical protein